MPFDPKALKAADYLEINPFGKVPVLVDGALTMSESVAIVQYLLDRYADGRLEPDRSSPEYGRFLQWLHFGESTLMGAVAEVAAHESEGELLEYLIRCIFIAQATQEIAFDRASVLVH